MRARSLKPGFFENEFLAELGPYAQLLFAGLWGLADREGKLEDRPARIKAQVFPYYEPDPEVDELLDMLDRAGFIMRYRVENGSYIKILTFIKHQNPHRKESPSFIPEPDQGQTKDCPRTDQDRNKPGGLLTPDSGLRTPDKISPDGDMSIDQGSDGPGSVVKKFIECWNAEAPEIMPRARYPTSGSREQAIRRAMKIRPDPGWWGDLFRSLGYYPFLIGENDRRWVADIDFVLKKWLKISEGGYRRAERSTTPRVMDLDRIVQAKEG